MRPRSGAPRAGATTRIIPREPPAPAPPPNAAATPPSWAATLALFPAALVASVLLVVVERATAARLDADLVPSPGASITVWALYASVCVVWAVAVAALEVVGRRSATVSALMFGALAIWPVSQVAAALSADPVVLRAGLGQVVELCLLAGGVLSCAGLGATFAGPTRAPWYRALSAVAVAAGLVVAGAFFLPGRQLPFHLACIALSGLLAVLGVRALTPPLPALVAALAGPILLGGAWQIATLDHPARAAAVFSSSTARDAVRGWLRPAPMTRDTGVVAPLRPAPQVAGRAPGTDIVLVVASGLRPDMLAHMPELAAWQDGAVTFARAYSQASAAAVSLPALLHGVESWELQGGAAAPRPESHLARVAALQGYRTAAVIDPHGFPEGGPPPALFAPFQEVVETPRGAADKGVWEALRGLESGPGPALVLLHVAPTLQPGFVGRPLGPGDGTWRARYLRAVAWLDEQLGVLFRELATRRHPTLVVVTSDHGQALGHRRIETSGPTVQEVEVRVPLAMAAPGLRHDRRDQVAGTVDLAPTLTAWAGAPPQPAHVGRNLLQSGPGPAAAATYVDNEDGTLSALVRGRDKLVYDRPAQTFHRLDLARDPGETRDVLGIDPVTDCELVNLLLARPGGPVRAWPPCATGRP